MTQSLYQLRGELDGGQAIGSLLKLNLANMHADFPLTVLKLLRGFPCCEKCTEKRAKGECPNTKMSSDTIFEL